MATLTMYQDLKGEWKSGIPPEWERERRQPEPINSEDFLAEVIKLRAQIGRSPEQEAYSKEVRRRLISEQERRHY